MLLLQAWQALSVLAYHREMIIVVAAALIDTDTGKVLVQQRPIGSSMAGLWEFPGGKIEAGESPEVALCRELHEELGILVSASDCVPLTFNTHPLQQEQNTDHSLLLLLYQCIRWHGVPCAQEGQPLKWCALEELDGLPMPPADLPFIDFLRLSVIKM
jgi:8-oxo-dGTP diphosphatase